MKKMLLILLACAIIAALSILLLDRRKPNVILIVIETFRKDYLTETTAPNLLKFAEESHVFENAYSTSAWTIPSHASLFTGLHPYRHRTISDPNGSIDIGGAGLRFNALEEKYLTLAEMLKRAGYETSAVTGNYLMFPATGLGQGFDTYIYPDAGEAEKNAAVLNEDIFAILDSAEKPFFLFVNYFDPHEPYDSPESKISRYPGYNRALLSQAFEVLAGRKRLNEKERRILAALYIEEIQYVDKQIGVLLEKLKRNSLYKNSIIIITSDHGEHLGENGLMLHGCSLDDPLIHVPLIAKLPHSGPPGKVNNYVQLTDIVPTILDACGIEYDKNSIDGRNLLETDRGVRSELHPIPVLVRLNSERFDKHQVLTISASGIRKLETTESVLGPVAPAEKQIDDPEMVETLRSLGYIF